ncbi:MAG: hypothetical protein ABH843_06500 [Candidatus Omnitrophota bacterium]
MKQVFKVLVPVALVSLMITGCGGSGVSEDKPISEVKSEAQTMSVEQLKGIVAKYQKVVESKKGEIDILKKKIQEIPVTEMLGEEAGKIKSEVTSITSSIKALTERLSVYSQALRSKR